MDSIALLVFLLFMAAMAVTWANAPALMGRDIGAERFVRNGIWRPEDAPNSDAPSAFVERVRRRERVALFGSAAAALVGVGVAFWLGELANSFLAVVTVTYLGRAATLAVSSAREASRFGGGPRLSRGRRLTYLDYIPRWGVVGFLLLQLGFTVAVLLAPSVDEATRPWLVGGLIASWVVAAAGCALAAWLAGSPLPAASLSELGWADALRRADVVFLLNVGPMSSVVLFTVIRSIPLWWTLAYLVGFAALGIPADRASRRIVEARRDTEQSVDAGS